MLTIVPLLNNKINLALWLGVGEGNQMTSHFSSSHIQDVGMKVPILEQNSVSFICHSLSNEN